MGTHLSLWVLTIPSWGYTICSQDINQGHKNVWDTGKHNECASTVFFGKESMQQVRPLHQFFWWDVVHGLEVCRDWCPILSRGPGESSGTLWVTVGWLSVSPLENCPNPIAIFDISLILRGYPIPPSWVDKDIFYFETKTFSESEGKLKIWRGSKTTSQWVAVRDPSEALKTSEGARKWRERHTWLWWLIT